MKTPTEFHKCHTKDFEDAIEKYILPYSHDKAEELMDKVYEIYAKIGYPSLSRKGATYFEKPKL